MGYDSLDTFTVSFYGSTIAFKKHVIKSTLLNGIYAFSVFSIISLNNGCSYGSRDGAISVAVSTQCGRYLYSYALISHTLITVYVHDEYLFLKLIEGDKVKSTASIHETGQLSICICSLIPQQNVYSCSFTIKNHVQ